MTPPTASCAPRAIRPARSWKTIPHFLGPAAIAQAYRFNADTRDRGFEARLAVLDQPGWRVALPESFQMHPVLSASILITKRINQTKRLIEKHKQDPKAIAPMGAP
jgi:succinate dehydrogenase/fumarate reductase-like Fe-S protein